MTDLKIGDVVRCVREYAPGKHTHFTISGPIGLQQAKAAVARGTWVKVEPQEPKQEPKQC